MTAEQLRDLVIELVDDAKGRDVNAVDVRGMTDITDYMIIVSGTSDRHVNAVAQRVSQGMRDHGRKPVGTEGAEDAEWIVLDFSDVIVHVMQPRVREFYDLDGLWSEDVRRLIESRRQARKDQETGTA